MRKRVPEGVDNIARFAGRPVPLFSVTIGGRGAFSISSIVRIFFATFPFVISFPNFRLRSMRKGLSHWTFFVPAPLAGDFLRPDRMASTLEGFVILLIFLTTKDCFGAFEGELAGSGAFPVSRFLTITDMSLS